MNYIGSKLSLMDFIQEGIDYVLEKNNDSTSYEKLTLCDLFAGTGAVGSFFKEQGMKIIANDSMFYSYVLNKHYIGNNDKVFSDNAIFQELNNLELINDGFIFNNYCLGGTLDDEYQRMYFSDRNGKFCDTVRTKIENLFLEQKISEKQYYFLLASLLESIDKHANTASVYGAFLKKIKTKAAQDCLIKPASIISSQINEHQVFQKDAQDLITKISGDILYLDPPYNSRQYCDNYHILETIARYDSPEIKGKTGLRLDNKANKSDFCYKNKAIEAFEYIVKNANFKYILLSYNDEGIIGIDDIVRIMSKYGDYSVLTKKYKRFKASSKDVDKKETIEYLHCFIKF
ncbi:DNA adenine methylase [Glaesserella parasuis]|nr:DNA adenine methylase [Glaesserella parasuis]